MSGKKGSFLNSSQSKNNGAMDAFFDTTNDIMTLDIEEIKANPYQPRKIFDEDSLNDLSNSIKHSGLIQPIIVRKDKEDYILVAGERRLRACKLAGLHTIKAIITKEDPIEVSMIENLQRENLKPVEEAEALNRMIKEYNYTQEKLAEVVGKKKSTISEILSINKIPEDIRDEVRRAELSKRILVEIAKQDSREKMQELIKAILNSELTSDQVRNITRQKNKTDETEKKKIKVLDKVKGFSKFLYKISEYDFIDDKEEILQELLDIKTKINDLLKK